MSSYNGMQNETLQERSTAGSMSDRRGGQLLPLAHVMGIAPGSAVVVMSRVDRLLRLSRGLRMRHLVRHDGLRTALIVMSILVVHRSLSHGGNSHELKCDPHCNQFP